MVAGDEAEKAATMLRMVIAGIAEDVIEMVASSTPKELTGHIAVLERLARNGDDIALAARSAASALEYASRSTI